MKWPFQQFLIFRQSPMKIIPSLAGYHHVSIVSLAETALGYTRAQNAQKLVDWLIKIANQTPYITGIETLIGANDKECRGNVFFKVIYTDASGLTKVRATAEHQKMMAWFEQICEPQRMNVDGEHQAPPTPKLINYL